MTQQLTIAGWAELGTAYQLMQFKLGGESNGDEYAILPVHAPVIPPP